MLEKRCKKSFILLAVLLYFTMIDFFFQNCLITNASAYIDNHFSSCMEIKINICKEWKISRQFRQFRNSNESK